MGRKLNILLGSVVFLYSCAVIPTQYTSDEIDQVVGWEGKIRVTTYDGEEMIFRKIIRDMEGNFMGYELLKEDSFPDYVVPLDVAQIKTIELTDKLKTSGRAGALIFIPLIALAVYVIWPTNYLGL